MRRNQIPDHQFAKELTSGPVKRVHVPTVSLGVKPGLNLTKALRLADELDSAEIVRELGMGK
jgi:hypothetical protein